MCRIGIDARSVNVYRIQVRMNILDVYGRMVTLATL